MGNKTNSLRLSDMTKRTNDHHDVPEGDKTKPAGDNTKDNLRSDRTVDNKVIEKDRGVAAEDFSVTNINVGEIQEANAKCQNSGSSFELVDSSSGDIVARSKTKLKSEFEKTSKDLSAPKPDSLQTDLLSEPQKSEKSKRKSEIYDSATISTKAVQSEQMSIYQKALEATTDPITREQLKHQATMLDKLASPETVSPDSKPNDSVSASLPSSVSPEFKSTAKQSFDATQQFTDLFNKNAKLGDSIAIKGGAHNESFPSTTQKDSLGRVTHVSNQVGDYDIVYGRDAKGMDTTFPSKISINEKSGQKHVYEKKPDGWHIDGAKNVSGIKNIDVNSKTGQITTNFKNGSNRINQPDGTIVRITPNRQETDFPDGKVSITDAIGTRFIRTPEGHGDFVEKHSGPRPDDNFTITQKSDGTLEVREKSGDKPYQRIDDPKIKFERDRLKKLAIENITNPEELSRFHANMARFENREHSIEVNLHKRGKSPEEASKLAHDEISKTFSQISRLLEAQNRTGLPVDELRRTRIAEQLIRNSATPTSIDQGSFNTCNVATVEVSTFSRHPAAATKLVVDMATEGKYVLRNGREIKINAEAFQNFSPDDLNPPDEGTRSLASQIFQVTAVNIHYQLEPIPMFRYEQLTPKFGQSRDNGERLVSNYPWDKTADHPKLTADPITEIAREITGDQPKEAFVMFESGRNDHFDTIADEGSLGNKLKYAKDHGLLPITIGVHTGNEPLYTDSGAGSAGGSGGWHVVNVMDYQDGAPPTVALDNQWGVRADHFGKNRISLDDLYFLMRSPTDKGQVSELESRRAHGTLKVSQELELDRHKFQNGGIKAETYEAAAKKHLLSATEQFNEGKLTATEYLRFIKQFNTKIHDFPPTTRIELVQFEKDNGTINQSQYKELLVNTAVQVQLEYDLLRADKTPHPNELIESSKAIRKFLDALVPLSKDEQVALKGRFSKIVNEIREGQKSSHK
jgi:hypothetical protein